MRITNIEIGRMLSNNKMSNMDARSKIYDHIDKNPAIHQAQISKALKIPLSTLRYHLRFLMKQNLIKINTDGGFIRYTTVDKIGRQEKKILCFIRKEVPRNILIYIASNVVCSQKELSKELHKTPSTIKFHINKLVKLDIIIQAQVENGLICRNKEDYYVDRRPVKCEKFYRLKNKDTVETLIKLFVRYRKSIPELNSLSSVIECISETKKLPRIMKNHQDKIDSMEKAFFEVLPHPYHV